MLPLRGISRGSAHSESRGSSQQQSLHWISVRASGSSSPAGRGGARSHSPQVEADFHLAGLGLTCLCCRGADDDGRGGHKTHRGPQAIPGSCVHHESTRLVVVRGRSQHRVTWGKAQHRAHQAAQHTATIRQWLFRNIVKGRSQQIKRENNSFDSC